MVSYPELVRKARELHNALGERKFRELYEEKPLKLIDDMRLRVSGSYTELERAGMDVLQAFPFHPLHPSIRAIQDRILEEHEKRLMLASALGDSKATARALRILEARGLVRLAKMGRDGPLVVTEVFDGKAWKKAMVPDSIRKSLTKAH